MHTLTVDVRVRDESSEDSAAIHALHAASFPTELEARLVDALRETRRLVVSLVAVEDMAIVGHAAFSPVSIAGAARGVGLGPVAVAVSRRRHGAADALIREGLRRCKKLGYGFAVVLGEPSYYRRFGFAAASRVGLFDEFGGGDAFQAVELEPGSMPAGAGVVRYAPEFAAFDSDTRT